MSIYVGDLSNISSGYSQAGLNYLMSLYTVGQKFSLFSLGNFVNWRLTPFWADPLSICTGELNIPRDVSILHQTPDLLSSMPNYCPKSIAITTLETSCVPNWIIDSINNSDIDHIVFPSSFNLDCFISSGLNKDCSVIPHSIGDWWWSDDEYLNANDDRPYTFIYSGSWNTRKNPELVLKAYIEAFPVESNDRCIMFKCVSGASLDNYFSDIVKNRSDIFLYNEVFNEYQMKWFFAQSDCFVSAHHGEGFGLGLLQAKLLGKRVIYTDWSAPTEFCSKDYGDYPIEYDLSRVSGMDEQHHHFRGDDSLFWANPNYDNLIESMRDAYNKGRVKLDFNINEYRSKYSWETNGRILGSLIDSLN